jgi:hypothetical protein
MVAEGITVAVALLLPVDTLVADMKYAATVEAETRPAQPIPAVDNLTPTHLAATRPEPPRPEPPRPAAMAASNAAMQPNVRAAVMAGVPMVAAVDTLAAVSVVTADTSN